MTRAEAQAAAFRRPVEGEECRVRERVSIQEEEEEEREDTGGAKSKTPALPCVEEKELSEQLTSRRATRTAD